MGRGKATVVENMEEKRYGLSVLMKTQTGKDFSFEDRMAEVVSVIRIDVDEYTAKLARAVSGMEMAKERDEAELSRLRALKAAFARKREEWNG
jgi:hypothetical protein